MSTHEDWISGRICVYNIGYHIVWSKKYRRQVIVGPIEERLKHLFKEIATEFEFEFREMEVMLDHCTVFVTCHPKKSPSDIVKCLKGISARKHLIEYPVIKKQLWGGHLWNPSYYIGTVGNMSKDVVLRYLQQQKSEGTGKSTSPNDRHAALHPLNELRGISAKFSKPWWGAVPREMRPISV